MEGAAEHLPPVPRSGAARPASRPQCRIDDGGSRGAHRRGRLGFRRSLVVAVEHRGSRNDGLDPDKWRGHTVCPAARARGSRGCPRRTGPLADASTSFRSQATQPGSPSTPAAWSPCRAIHYVVRPRRRSARWCAPELAIQIMRCPRHGWRVGWNARRRPPRAGPWWRGCPATRVVVVVVVVVVVAVVAARVGCVRVGGVRVRWFVRRGVACCSARRGGAPRSSGLRGAWCGVWRRAASRCAPWSVRPWSRVGRGEHRTR